MKQTKTLLFLAVLMQSHVSWAALPAEILQALEAAEKTNNQYVINAVIASATKSYPKQAVAINNYAISNKTSAPKPVKKTLVKTKDIPFSGNIELGARYSSGNTSEEDINAALKLIYKNDKWENTLRLKAFGSKEEDIRNNEEYRISNKTSYLISTKDYAFLELDYVNDRFGGFKQRTTENFGYGRYFFNDKQFKLSGEIGLGARQNKDFNDITESSFIQKLAGNLYWEIYDGIILSEEIQATFGQDSTITTSETALKTKLINNLFLKLAYNVEHISDVPVNKENTDTTTLLSIVYDF